MPRPRLRTQLSLELEPQLLERLRARAAAEGRPLSALVRRWLEAAYRQRYREWLEGL